VHLHDAADDGGIGEQIVVVPRSMAARRRGRFEPRAKRGLDGDDEAIVHAQ